MNRKNKSSLFLLELVISIFFFAASSAICVGLFVGSYQTSQRSVELNQAVFLAQTAAETIKSYPGQTGWNHLEGLIPQEEGRAVVYYDKNWNTVQQESVYTLELEAQEEHVTQISVKKEEETLFAIEAVSLLGEGGESVGQ